jgi:hypothetical protein
MIHIDNVPSRKIIKLGAAILIIELFFFVSLQGQGSESSRGGYITPLNLSAIPQASYWQGYFGEVIVGGLGSSNIVTAKGGNLTELNLYFTSNCSVASLSGEIYATTAGSVQWSKIAAGKTAHVDSYLDLNANSPESGTNTFTTNLSYNVSGSIINAPATYTFVNSSPSSVFDTGVLNDTAELVYVTQVQADQTGFESNTHDFQMILPVPLSSTPTYYFSAELDIVCAPIDFSLNPSDIVFSDNSPKDGEDISINATIHNTENGSYENFIVSLLVDNVTRGNNTISIGGNSVRITQFSWTAVLGIHEITVGVDPFDSVIETNESNNNATKQITVLSPPTTTTTMKGGGGGGGSPGGGVTPQPSCFDGISNQGEEGVDCGGPCAPCLSCSDGIQNQDETSIDCGGRCSPCPDGESCLLYSDCLSGWCHEGICKTPSCSDGIRNQDEMGVDCGGSCLPCHCFDNIRNYDETDTDCGGSCHPCQEVGVCLKDSDCISGWCHEGTCRVSTCDDGIKGPGEENMDCGGGCRECPQIWVENEVYLGENLTITIKNPLEGTILRIKDPTGKTMEYVISDVLGLQSLIIQFKPDIEGLYSLVLVNYDEEYVRIKEKTTILPDWIRNLLLLLIPTGSFFVWLLVRRTKVVADELAIRSCVSEDVLYWELLKSYKRVYTAGSIERDKLRIKNLVFVDLNADEMDLAENLSKKYDISLDEAKSLVLCKRLRAKKLITGMELPKEIGGRFEGTKIIKLHDEFRLMRLHRHIQLHH